ncbi:hypothetical protein VTL71DRAFT_664 [Oculimacula yallundae]|uniref:Uncharacterized protein n=1 Tax=Oculimacula yallundae TaxID=86028 RepID=A0ABR4D2Z6_9HELO
MERISLDLIAAYHTAQHRLSSNPKITKVTKHTLQNFICHDRRPHNRDAFFQHTLVFTGGRSGHFKVVLVSFQRAWAED